MGYGIKLYRVERDMRHYHLRWVLFLYYLAPAAALVFFLLNVVFGSSGHRLEFAQYALYCMLFAIALQIFMGAFSRFRSDDLWSPTCPEGLAVDPSGVWVEEDMPLRAGARVLARSRGIWHRAVVVRLRSRKRVEVHFTGWAPFWDSVLPQSKLQVDPNTLLDNEIVPKRESETAFREKR